jgi:hypothetical protein
MPNQAVPRARLQFRAKNYAFLTASLLSLGLGFMLLAQGSTTAAPILLVLGYCVLIPVGLTL